MEPQKNRKHEKSENVSSESDPVKNTARSPSSLSYQSIENEGNEMAEEDERLQPAQDVLDHSSQIMITANQGDESDSSTTINASSGSGWETAADDDNASSHRSDRIVQLIQNTDNVDRTYNWVISPAFYNEDIVGIQPVRTRPIESVVIDQFNESDTRASHLNEAISVDDNYESVGAPQIDDEIEEHATSRDNLIEAESTNASERIENTHNDNVANMQSTDSEDNILRSQHTIPTNRQRNSIHTDRSSNNQSRRTRSSSNNNNPEVVEIDNRYAGQQIRPSDSWERDIGVVHDNDQSDFGDDDDDDDDEEEEEDNDEYMVHDFVEDDDDRNSWHGEGRFDYDDEDEDQDIEEEELDDDDDIMDHDFVVANELTESGTDDEDVDDLEVEINYDRTLPDNHAYLGDNLEESRGREVLEENSSAILSLVNLDHVVLFPGQTLPLAITEVNNTIHYRVRHSLIQCINGKSKTIGIMCDPQTNDIGTTAELRNFSIDETTNEMRLIFEGRQRFKLLSPPFETALTDGLVKIIPEITLGNPYPQIRSSLYGFNPQRPGTLFNHVSKFPNFLFSRYDAKEIVSKITDHIKDWSKLVDIKNDPKDFSYWMSANLPICNEYRMKSLKFACTEARLLWLLELLNNCQFFGCSNCQNDICKKDDVFPMSQTGAQVSFVNASGYIHDTITVKKAHGIAQAYAWTNDYSWFPGYAWSYAYCNQCNQHLGWCYKANDPKTKPKRFVGFTRSNIRIL